LSRNEKIPFPLTVRGASSYGKADEEVRIRQRRLSP
jgi:hypothetical protein